MILKTDLLQQALRELIPDFPNWYGWAKVDSDGNKIPSDQRMQVQYVVVEETHTGKVQRPTNEAIQAKITELQADYDSKQYQRDRKLEYPTIEELVVALYDEEDKASIIEKRNAVKAKYPKPE